MQYRFTRIHKAHDIDLLFSYIPEKIGKKEKKIKIIFKINKLFLNVISIKEHDMYIESKFFKFKLLENQFFGISPPNL